ncbi:hypothetical protein ACWGJT_04150 [Streptomyces xantholiticus]
MDRTTAVITQPDARNTASRPTVPHSAVLCRESCAWLLRLIRSFRI